MHTELDRALEPGKPELTIAQSRSARGVDETMAPVPVKFCMDSAIAPVL